MKSQRGMIAARFAQLPVGNPNSVNLPNSGMIAARLERSIASNPVG
jgi:hypothetical protein